jgi:MarR-like DNA-binding transcriptional regulator SgrR of sgrS sRNA
MKRKILVAAMLFALAAPTHAVMLRWAAQNDILTLDPHSQNHATTISIMQHCYEALVRYDKKFQIEPGLAASWEQVTPTQWRFKLRQNVKFHDGSPFTADDVGVLVRAHQAAAGHDATLRPRASRTSRRSTTTRSTSSSRARTRCSCATWSSSTS